MQEKNNVIKKNDKKTESFEVVSKIHSNKDLKKSPTKSNIQTKILKVVLEDIYKSKNLSINEAFSNGKKVQNDKENNFDDKKENTSIEVNSDSTEETSTSTKHVCVDENKLEIDQLDNERKEIDEIGNSKCYETENKSSNLDDKVLRENDKTSQSNIEKYSINDTYDNVNIGKIQNINEEITPSSVKESEEIEQQVTKNVDHLMDNIHTDIKGNTSTSICVDKQENYVVSNSNDSKNLNIIDSKSENKEYLSCQENIKEKSYKFEEYNDYELMEENNVDFDKDIKDFDEIGSSKSINEKYKGYTSVTEEEDGKNFNVFYYEDAILVETKLTKSNPNHPVKGEKKKVSDKNNDPAYIDILQDINPSDMMNLVNNDECISDINIDMVTEDEFSLSLKRRHIKMTQDLQELSAEYSEVFYQPSKKPRLDTSIDTEDGNQVNSECNDDDDDDDDDYDVEILNESELHFNIYFKI